MFLSLTPTSIALLAFVSFILPILILTRRPRHFPPGPAELPIIGNLHQLPTKCGLLATFTEWNEKYGDVIGLRVLGRPAIVLGSHRAVHEIMEKRAASCSARPKLVMIDEIAQINKYPSLNSDPVVHKQARRLFAKAFSSRGVQAYHTILITEMRRAVLTIMESNDGHAWLVPLRRAVASLTTQIVYAQEARTEDDPFFCKVMRLLKPVGMAGKTGTYVVEAFQFLKHLPGWFPGASFKHEGQELHDKCLEAVNEPYDIVRDNLAAGTAESCFVADMLQGEDGQIVMDQAAQERLKWAAGALLLAGTDTTVATLQMVLVALLQYPSVQQRAQAEFDSVIGRDRLPTIEDRENLPYCTAIMQEILRWNPVVPLCVPHQLTEDIEYNDRVLPKGSIVVANTWALSREASVYADGDTFIPERFMNPSTVLGTDGREVFGFGRRKCPGIHLSEASIFAFICTFVWAASMCPSKNWDGSELQYEDGGSVVNRPKNLPAEAKPRSQNVVEMLKNAVL
ncbi:cytochrome P450 [Dacryopinax primogenitus]|uniref:Cytochrome P450 n=1 Tax=Dacryopinax primogenitus (strain DJM 731) TaxID=1858805 RepID=M5FSN3_DACPD|nr:cytochrome P450 [Dacryopinax primogenitus]EJT98938.1 cytochrome P450 [Dacryopinax primogenitus]